MNQKIKVGDTLFLQRKAHRGGEVGELQEVKVTAVGSKYFTIDNHADVKFHIDTLREKTDFRSLYHLYRSREEKLHIEEIEQLRAKVTGYFRSFWGKSLTLDQWRRVSAVIDEAEAAELKNKQS